MTAPIPVVINTTAAQRVDLSVRNNADWVQPFAFYDTYAPTAPWALVDAWGPSIDYQSVLPASVVTYLGDLYVASVTAPQTWISAANFAADAGNWVLIGTAVSYNSVSFDLTGAILKMTVSTLDASGNIAAPRRPLLTMTSDGSDGNSIAIVLDIPLTNGNIAFDLLATRAETVPPGVYGYDLVIIQGGETITAMFGQITVSQGATV